jgi:sulfur-oxidizing protein SoxZ
MSDPMKIRASNNGTETEVRVIMSHPMETGLRKDAAGATIPAHFIQDVVATYNGKIVLQCQWSQSVAQNPYLAFKFKGGAKGEKVQIEWTDNLGEKRSDEATIA